MGLKPLRVEARLGTASSMRGGVFLAADPVYDDEYRRDARGRQARPGRPDRPVLGQARASSIGWQPLTAYTWDVFALGGGGVVAQACIGVLVGRGIGQLRWFLRPRGSSEFGRRATG